MLSSLFVGFIVYLSIIGVSIFIINIEYKTPSGIFDLNLKSIVKNAAPIANNIFPKGSTGEVTGSVSMNIPPNTSPPIPIWTSAKCNGDKPCVIPEINAIRKDVPI